VKKWTIALCGILLLSFSAPGEGQQAPSIQMYIFYAEDCPNCQAILQSYVPTLKTQYPLLDIKTFDLANPIYYEALAKLEKKFNRRGNELPVIFIGDQMLSGEREVMERLDPLILDYQMKGDLIPPLPPVEITSVAENAEKKFSVELAYFYQKGCSYCDRANYLLKYLFKKYPHLKINEIDLNTPDGKRLNETLSNRLNLPPEKRLIAPSIFIGNDYLSPEEVTESRVEALIQKYTAVVRVGDQKSISPSLSLTPDEIQKADASIIERFQSFGILAILLAGLIEGMNPCALATLVFFISYLTMVGRKRKEIFMAGMGFSASSFVTHLLLGFGILNFIQYFSFFPLFSRIVYLITFIFSLFLGIFSLYDYIQLKKGRPSKMRLQVPDFLKKRIHRIIRTRSSEFEEDKEGQSARLLIIAIFIGFIVTLLQSTCTSQVYLPTLLFVTNIPSLRGSAIFYLILYNLIYILPLLVIFGIVYWGVTSEQLSLFLQKRASTIKLFTSIFFFALAGILMVSFL
jgi:cytochrome c biogenesis protein CcdA/thiol-disulfide isomerase/thioredoxin/glutaredoxin